VRLVSCADKLNNATAILWDYEVLGEALWSRFMGGKQGTLWYYRSIADRYLALKVGPLAEELKRVVTRLEKLVGESRDKSGSVPFISIQLSCQLLGGAHIDWARVGVLKKRPPVLG